jgi:threonine dehydrogenase-like Zn-dependent dehydrogenase
MSRGRVIMTRINQALWLPAQKIAPKVAEVPLPEAGPGQIVVRSAAFSVNPIDWILQSVGGLIFPWLKYPLVLGWDVAGEVVATGRGVTRFRVGDRVFGLAVGQDKSVNDPAESAFQNHVVLRDHMVEQGAVLPLALSTAACGLFQTDKLALVRPEASPRPTGKTVLVWGGSTSVGSNAIQLAVAAGYDVFTTASPRNHDYVRQLGASQAFDYRSPTVVPDIVRALQGREFAGALAIGTGSAIPCVEISGASDGNKFVALATPPVSFEDAPTSGSNRLWLVRKLTRLILGNIRLVLRASRSGVRFKFINGSTLLNDGVGRMIYVDFLPEALASGRYRAVPEPLVSGKGLSALPEAMAKHKNGISAKKIVVMA